MLVRRQNNLINLKQKNPTPLKLTILLRYLV